MKVLIACEFSGRVRDAFTARGHYAMSADLIDSETEGLHFKGDVLNVLDAGFWDLMIAHPPCTYLANSSNRWLYGGKGKIRDEDRWIKMEESAHFFKQLLGADIPKIAVENPIMHGYAKKIIGKEPDQFVQPWMFGQGESKSVGLWLKGLPRLKATNIVEGRTPRVHFESPSENRWKNRSRTYEGIAAAMAEQWG